MAMGLIGLSPTTADAVTLSCGDTITTDTTLTADVTCTSYSGVYFGARGITLDLNGYSITSTSHTGAGVYNDGFDGVTIQNGTISGFFDGVDVVVANRNTVQDLTLLDLGGTGIYVIEGNGNKILGNTYSDPFGGGGINIVGSRNVIDGNSITGAGGIGIIVQGGLVLTARGNKVTFNDTNGNGQGIEVDSASARTLVEGNHANNNTSAGISIYSPSTTLTNNEANDNGTTVSMRRAGRRTAAATPTVAMGHRTATPPDSLPASDSQ
jgi:parallel beta-helix repeat protein